MEILITYVNAVWMQISADRSVLMEISDKFSFRIPNAHFNPKVRARLWDGRIRLLKRDRMYRGLLGELEKWAAERDYKVIVLNPDDEFQQVSTDVPLPAKFEVRDYQKAMVDMVINKNHRLTMLSPTSSGKSLMIYMIVYLLLQHYPEIRGLIVVPRLSLVKQLFTDFEDYSAENNFDVDGNIHMIFSGQDHKTDKRVVVSTWQSIYKNDPKWFQKFDFVIGDECHEFKAKSLVTIMENLSNAIFRVGTTGTLDGVEVNEMTLIGLFGPKVQATTTRELQSNKFIAQLTIKCIVLGHPVGERIRRKYEEEISYLTSSEARNNYICNLAAGLKGNTLVLFRLIENHGDILYKILEAKNTGRPVYYIHGGVEADVREEIRKIVNKQKDAIILASIGTFAMGVNLPNLHNIILASPTKSKIKTLQSIGRVLRLSENKDIATLIDVSDDLRKGTYVNHTFKHFLERVKIYSAEEFNFKTYTVELK